MARGDQLGRQWKIIQKLISSKKGKTASALSDDLGCTKRTIYRDLEALQKAGFPVLATMHDGMSRWSIIESYKSNIPIPLSITELMALYFSKDMLKIFKGTVYYASIESLFNKISATLSPEYLSTLDKIKKSLDVGPRPYKDYGKFSHILSALNEAILNRKKIKITYFTMSRGEESTRRIAPYRLRYTDQSLYLIGYCSKRKDVRTFAIDRIKSLRLTDQTFQIPEDFDMDAFSEASFGIFHGDPISVKIRFSKDVAGYIKEKIWHNTQNITDQADGSIVFSAEVAGLEEIRYWVMRWGGSARVLEPEALKTAIQREAEKILGVCSKKVSIHGVVK